MIKLKSQKGAITLYVLIAMLFLTMFLMGIYVIQTNRHQTQLEANAEIRKKYDPSLNEIDVYNGLFDSGEVIPIYTMSQLEKIGSGETIAIPEENGKRYIFDDENKTYVLMNNLQKSVNSINDWNPVGYKFSELTNCKLEGNGKNITIMVNNVPYVYTQKTEFKYVLNELGYVRNNLILHYDGIKNSGLENPHNAAATNWVDLSGNGNNATMVGFNGTKESGWNSTHLSFDGINDVAYREMNISGNNSCIEVVYKYYSGSYIARSDANVRTDFKEIILNKGDPAVGTVVQRAETITSYVLQWKTINGSLYYDVYINGERKAYNVAFSNASNGTYISLGAFTKTFAEGSKIDLYAVRVYNKDLTQEEIANNYKIDTQRFGIN